MNGDQNIRRAPSPGLPRVTVPHPIMGFLPEVPADQVFNDSREYFVRVVEEELWSMFEPDTKMEKYEEHVKIMREHIVKCRLETEEAEKVLHFIFSRCQRRMNALREEQRKAKEQENLRNPSSSHRGPRRGPAAPRAQVQRAPPVLPPLPRLPAYPDPRLPSTSQAHHILNSDVQEAARRFIESQRGNLIFLPETVVSVSQPTRKRRQKASTPTPQMNLIPMIPSIPSTSQLPSHLPIESSIPANQENREKKEDKYIWNICSFVDNGHAHVLPPTFTLAKPKLRPLDEVVESELPQIGNMKKYYRYMEKSCGFGEWNRSNVLCDDSKLMNEDWTNLVKSAESPKAIFHRNEAFAFELSLGVLNIVKYEVETGNELLEIMNEYPAVRFDPELQPFVQAHLERGRKCLPYKKDEEAELNLVIKGLNHLSIMRTKLGKPIKDDHILSFLMFSIEHYIGCCFPIEGFQTIHTILLGYLSNFLPQQINDSEC